MTEKFDEKPGKPSALWQHRNAHILKVTEAIEAKREELSILSPEERLERMKNVTRRTLALLRKKRAEKDDPKTK